FCFAVSFVVVLQQPRSSLFPYTTLFRSELIINILIVLSVYWVYRAALLSLGSIIGIFKVKEAEKKDWMQEINNLNFSELPDQERSEEHTSELQSRENLVCRHLLEKKRQS